MNLTKNVIAFLVIVLFFLDRNNSTTYGLKSQLPTTKFLKKTLVVKNVKVKKPQKIQTTGENLLG